MKTPVALLLSFLCAYSPSVFASPTLQFSARIKSERLAEEAIDFLHCLSDELSLPWELMENGSGDYRLNLTETNGGLDGALFLAGEESAFRLLEGEAERECRKILPAEAKVKADHSDLLDTWAPQELNRKQWLWIGAAVAIAASGFFLWKSGRPDHRSIRMD